MAVLCHARHKNGLKASGLRSQLPYYFSEDVVPGAQIINSRTKVLEPGPMLQKVLLPEPPVYKLGNDTDMIGTDLSLWGESLRSIMAHSEIKSEEDDGKGKVKQVRPERNARAH